MIIEDPLQCRIDKDKIIISIGFDALKFLAENSDVCEKYDEEFCPDGIWTEINNKKEFAKEVLKSLKHEQEDGTTVVHKLFEDAINMALENGAEGVKLI